MEGKPKSEIVNVWAQAKEMIAKWARRKNFPIRRGYQPEDKVLWQLMNAEFHGTLGYTAAATKGLTPFSGMTVSANELENRKNVKKAIEESADTCTRSEALQIIAEKGDLPNPPCLSYR